MRSSERRGFVSGHAVGPTSLLIIRAWIEEGSSQPLRCFIRVSTDVGTGIERSLTLSQPDDVAMTVNEWLAEIMTRSNA